MQGKSTTTANKLITVHAILRCTDGGSPQQYQELKDAIFRKFLDIQSAFVVRNAETYGLRTVPGDEFSIHIKARISPWQRRFMRSELINFGLERDVGITWVELKSHTKGIKESSKR